MWCEGFDGVSKSSHIRRWTREHTALGAPASKRKVENFTERKEKLLTANRYVSLIVAGKCGNIVD